MNQDDARKLSLVLKDELKGLGFLTKSMEEMADLIEDTLSITLDFPLDADMLELLEENLKHEGILVYPPFNAEDEFKRVRLYRSGTLVGDFINTIARPDNYSDSQLGTYLTKVRGHWNWTRAAAE